MSEKFRDSNNIHIIAFINFLSRKFETVRREYKTCKLFLMKFFTLSPSNFITSVQPPPAHFFDKLDI